jgi:integrase
MPRHPKPWYRKDRDAWFVTIAGVRHNLGPKKKEAMARFYKLMREPTLKQVSSQSVVAIADAFLDWLKNARSARTYEWYQYRLQWFCQRYKDLLIADLRPYHVQQWVDSYPDLSQNSKRNYYRTLKRCVRWAKQQGYIQHNPIEDMQLPGAEHREVCVSQEDFDRMLSFVHDPGFINLCRVTYKTGCRPQEILALEARHVDLSLERWIFPRSEAKGKKQPRIVYMCSSVTTLIRTLVKRHPTGPIFRNSRDNPWSTDAVNCAFCRLRERMAKDAMKKIGTSLPEQIALALKSSGQDLTVKSMTPSQKRKLINRIVEKFAPKYSLYALRHSWATRALQQSGMDSLTVAILMGHNDPSTLSRVYQHLAHNPEHMLQQARKAAGEQS